MTQHAGRRRSLIAAAASVVLALVAAVILFVATRGSEGPPQPAADAGLLRSTPAPTTTAPAPTRKATTGGARATGPAPTDRGQTDLGPSLSSSPPVAITIPSIGIRTSTFVGLGLAGDGSLEVPKDFAAVGWYTQGPAPGQLGPAILAGHVDSHNGPAVFYRLGALRPGAQVSIGRKDGSTATFTVDRIQRFSKDHFPIAQVYGNVHRAELRLITCGGSFDQNTGHYVDNVVAFAHLTA